MGWLIFGLIMWIVIRDNIVGMILEKCKMQEESVIDYAERIEVK